MEFVSGLAVVLLALVGYCSGAVLGARKRVPVPGLLDLLVVLGIWIAALATRAALGKWLAIAVWLGIGLVVGAFLAVLRKKQYAPAKSSAKSVADHRGFFAKLGDSWKGFARRMGNYQSRVLMSALYFTVVLPFGFGVTVFGDPLAIKQNGNADDGSQSNWRVKTLPVVPSLDEAGRQY